MTQDAIDGELTAMLGNPAMVRAVKGNLARLRDGVAGDELAEMARDLLDGRISLRQVTRTGVYTEALLTASAPAAEWVDSMTPEELERVAAEAQETVARDTVGRDDT